MAVHRPGVPARGPRPFGYVPLYVGPVERSARLLQGHERYLAERLSGRLRCTLTALSPVHVGAGRVERTARVDPARAEETPLLHAHLRSAGVPTLPASLLKGIVRSVVEAITPSCLGVRGRLTALPADFGELETCPRRGRGREEAYCATCRLFGALGYQARLRFGDAALNQGTTTLHLAPPLPPTRLARGGPLPGRKFYQHGEPAAGTVPLEVCPVGSRFDCAVDFVNLGPAELGLLMLALGLGEPPLALKVGGYRPACLGSVSAELRSLSVDDPRGRALTYAPEPAHASLEPAPYLAALTDSGLLLDDRQERMAEILRYPGGGTCPAATP